MREREREREREIRGIKSIFLYYNQDIVIVNNALRFLYLRKIYLFFHIKKLLNISQEDFILTYSLPSSNISFYDCTIFL